MVVAVVLILMLLGGCTGDYQGYEPLDGDIIFHVSDSWQSQAIQLATGSKYSHMGLVFWQDGEPKVLEAVQPVQIVPLAVWIADGEDDHFTVRRLRDCDASVIDAAKARFAKDGVPFLHRDYDSTFEWSDDRIYCSELVWKIYDRELGLELAPLAYLGDFDLTHPTVQAAMKKKWPDGPPLDMKVISPAAILDSPLLDKAF